jgi:hypothetical protein
MEKNIFIKNKKYNPDIIKNYSKKLDERSQTKFEYKNEFINTSNVNKDQEVYKTDEPKSEIDKLIQQRINEREKQEFEFKPTKNFIPTSNPGDFHEYNELKNDQNKYELKNKEKDDNFNDILSDLQKLGILKK